MLFFISQLAEALLPSFRIVATETRQSWEASKAACRSLGGTLLDKAMTRGKDKDFYYRSVELNAIEILGECNRK